MRYCLHIFSKLYESWYILESSKGVIFRTQSKSYMKIYLDLLGIKNELTDYYFYRPKDLNRKIQQVIITNFKFSL